MEETNKIRSVKGMLWVNRDSCYETFSLKIVTDYCDVEDDDNFFFHNLSRDDLVKIGDEIDRFLDQPITEFNVKSDSW